MRALAAAVLLVLAVPAAAAPGPGAPDAARARSARLRVRAPEALALAATGAAAWGASAAAVAADDVRACRWCEPGRLDLRLRGALAWDDAAAAGRASDALLAVVPAASAAAVAGLAALDRAGGREVIEDVALVLGAVLLDDPLTVSVKHHTARLRPGAWAAGGPRAEGDLHSFFSGHASRVFAAAAAATQVARLRGRRGWRWLAVATFGAAAATGWLRLAADQHWGTDVLAGAAAGTAVGLAVPALALRGDDRARALALAPAPGGLAIVF